MSSGVYMLTKCLKISDTTKTDFLEQNSFQNDQKILSKYCHEDLRNLSNPLTSWLSISILARGFLGI